ncbi:DUF6303 family protein [Streptomyces sp. NPDC005402]|uniref:DUF6303 family protein n=1 Tax=Streptomyces sp. NPDC005402 TaxID=3155338 RepID=UPI0033AFDE2B
MEAEPICALLQFQTTEEAPDGEWRLFLGLANETVFPINITWSFSRMPSLMERYDALRYLGYAVFDGGPEAWKWQEGALADGSPGLLGVTDIRPLTAAEEQAQPVGTTSQR